MAILRGISNIVPANISSMEMLNKRRVATAIYAAVSTDRYKPSAASMSGAERTRKMVILKSV
jgi:hypothetical protein